MSAPALMMTRDMWGALSSFAWADYARKHWRTLPKHAQQKVVRAANAELAANVAYVLADDAIEAYIAKVRR